MPEAAWVAAAMGGVFGLLIGSFLNVVIYRLPKMLERQWASECAQLSGKDAPEAAAFNLVTPASRCQKCGHAIRWYENIPLISFMVLAGKCSACKSPIGLRYPIVELAAGLLQVPQKVDTAHAGEIGVYQQVPFFVFTHLRQKSLAAGERSRDQAMVFENLAQGFTKIIVIVDHDHLGSGRTNPF